MATNIVLTAEPLSIQACADWVMTPEAGGIDMFIGTVRNATKGKAVVRLEFEAYAPMAVNEMTKIATDMLTKWPLHKVLIHHRTGVLPIGEIPVIIAVSAAHRAAAFDACRYAIDTLKQTVPIWKKEFFEDGEQWVTPTP
jgi:molybdopterin synthase catalytic subunit